MDMVTPPVVDWFPAEVCDGRKGVKDCSITMQLWLGVFHDQGSVTIMTATRHEKYTPSARFKS